VTIFTVDRSRVSIC